VAVVAPENPIQKRAFWITAALPAGCGVLLDVCFGLTFFTFDNHLATLGKTFWGFSPAGGLKRAYCGILSRDLATPIKGASGGVKSVAKPQPVSSSPSVPTSTSATLSRASYGYDAASRLSTVTDANNNSATYSYLANSPLVDHITFQQNGVTRMTTANEYDALNRLVSKRSGNGLNYAYQYNTANQRTEAVLGDGSHWDYQYDALGQVTSGKKYWSDWTPVAGDQFEYAFDNIGNRTSTKAGGESAGYETSLRSATYTVNNLNQYIDRTVPGAADVMGLAYATAAVTVNGNSAYRKGEFYDYSLGLSIPCCDTKFGPVQIAAAFDL
jgi:YD repeat-containing protein